MRNILIEKDTMNDKWKNPRIFYLKSFIRATPSTCPECGNNLEQATDGDETYCTYCGLVCSASIEYVAGQKIFLPYGRH